MAPKVIEIGNPKGLIAIYCDESEANDIASHFKYPDKFADEIYKAIELAYPKDDEAIK